jgi:hypothetical protein
MLEFDSAEEKSFPQKATTEKIIGARFEVQRHLGYRFLERVYQRAMQVELVRQGLKAEIERRLTIGYKDAIVGDYMPIFTWPTASSWKSKSRRNTTSVTKLNYLTN